MHRKDLAWNPACEVLHMSQLLLWLSFFLRCVWEKRFVPAILGRYYPKGLGSPCHGADLSARCAPGSRQDTRQDTGLGGCGPRPLCVCKELAGKGWLCGIRSLTDRHLLIFDLSYGPTQ